MRTIPSGVFEFGKLPACPSVRGVVVGGPYFADDQAEREAAARQRDPSFYQVTTVAVDVLTYGSRFRTFLAKVPIVPQRHALNDYTSLWIPRVSSTDLRTGAAPVLSRADGTPSDPKDLDGDHVLVEFLENDTAQPYIRSELPHPRTAYRQLHAAGDAVESRFRGVVTRIDKDGNVLVDTTKANSGAITAQGAETPALDAGHGKVTLRMGHNAPFVLEGVDADGGAQKFKVEIDPAAKKFRVRLDNGLSLEITDKDANAILQLGGGAVNAAIYQHLETWWNTVAWPAIQIAFDTHVHASAMGPTAVPVPLMGVSTPTAGTLAGTPSGASIKANKVKITDG